MLRERPRSLRMRACGWMPSTPSQQRIDHDASSSEALASYTARYEDVVSDLEELAELDAATEEVGAFVAVMESLAISDGAARQVFAKLANDQAADAIVDARISEELAAAVTASLRRISIDATQRLEERLETVTASVRGISLHSTLPSRLLGPATPVRASP